jgi:hypothetical protein
MDQLEAFWRTTLAPLIGPLDQYEIYWREVLLGAIALLMFFIAGTLWNLRGLYRRVLEQEEVNIREMPRPAHDLESEMQRMRQDIDTLRAELVRMQKARPARGGGYGDAADLARQGVNAASIAEQCGISVAEAELVQSMNRTHAVAG